MASAFKFGQPISLVSLPSDPSGLSNGSIYYNTTLSQLRIFQNNFWGTPTTAADLTAYLKADGTTAITGNLVPVSSGTKQLGTSSLLFSSVYAQAFNLALSSISEASGNLTLTPAVNNNIVLAASGTGAISANNVKIINLATPTDNFDASTKKYVDDAIASIPSVDLSNYLKKDGTVKLTGSLLPETNSTYNLGSASLHYDKVHSNYFEVYFGATLAGEVYGQSNGLNLEASGIDKDVKLTPSGVGAVDVSSKKIKNLATPTSDSDASTKKYVDDGLALKLNLSGGSMSGNITMNGNKVVGLGAPTAANDAIRLVDLQNAQSGVDYQPNIDGIQVDASLAPSLVLGSRYILTDISQLNAGFGTIAGVGNGDIVEYDGAAFVIKVDVSTKAAGSLILVGNRADDQQYEYKKSAGVWSIFYGFSANVAGTGLSLTGNVLDIKLGAGIAELPADEVGIDVHPSGGLITTVDNVTSSTATASQLAIKLADGSLSKSTSGLAVATSGISNVHIAPTAAIDFSKMASLSASKALISDVSGVVSSSVVTSLELAQLSGISTASTIAAQLNAKANTQLSNLSGTTAVSVPLLPDVSFSRNLGSLTTAWSVVFASAYRGAKASSLISISTNGTSTVTIVGGSTTASLSIQPNSSVIFSPLFANGYAAVASVSGGATFTVTNSGVVSTGSDSSASLTYSATLRTEDDSTTGLSSGTVNLRSGNVGSGKSGFLNIRTGDSSISGGTSGDVLIRSGNIAAGSGNSGNVVIQSGTVSSGVRGNVITSANQVVLKNQTAVVIQDATSGAATLAAKAFSLAANQTSFASVDANLYFTASGVKSQHMQYEIVDSVTGSARSGKLWVCVGNVAAGEIGYSDTYVSSNNAMDTIEFLPVVNTTTGVVDIQFKGTGANSCTFKLFTAAVSVSNNLF